MSDDDRHKATSSQDSRGLTLGFALLFEGSMIPIAIVLALLVGVQPWEVTWFDGWSLAMGVAGVLPMLLGFTLLWNSSAAWVREIHASIDELIVPLFDRSPLVGTILVSALAGIGEELLFRGVIQEALVGPLGLLPALVVASVLFGAAHWITPGYGIMATLAGLYLGAIYIWSGNLLVPIVAHAVFDFVALQVYLARSPSNSLGDL